MRGARRSISPAAHRELIKRKHLTLQLLWHEYREVHPDGYSYSLFCELYRQWKTGQDLVMLQEHKAGEKLFVDYAGQTVAVDDWETSSEREAYVVVGALGASSFFYCEATWGQDLEAWFGAHVRTFEDMEGVPEILVVGYVPRDIIGDSDLRTVLRYVNDRQPRMDRAMERFDKVIVASSGTG